MLVLIERGEKHEICNTGTEALKTLNFYVPPAYTKAGNERSPENPDVRCAPAEGARASPPVASALPARSAAGR